MPNVTSCTHRYGQFKRWSNILSAWGSILNHLFWNRKLSLGSSCRKTWALTHQLKFTLGSCGCGNKPQSFQMPLLHCLGDNVAFPVPASAGAVWSRSDFGEWVTCFCSHNNLPRHVSVVLTTFGDSAGAAVSFLLSSTCIHQRHLN